MTGFVGLDPERVVRLRAALDELDLRLARLAACPLSPESTSVIEAARRARRIGRDCHDAVIDAARSWFVGTMVAVALVEWGRPDAGWWVDRVRAPSTLADHALTAIADDPVAVDVVASRGSSVAALTWGAIDGDAVLRFWLDATDPARVDEVTAGRRIRTLLRVYFDEHYWRGGISSSTVEDPGMVERERRIREWLGLIVAPWQLHFTGLAHRWGWTSQEGGATLRALLDDERAADSVAAGLPRAVESALGRLPHDVTERRRLTEAVAFGIGASGQLLGEAAVAESYATVDLAHDLVNLVGFGLPLTRSEQMVVGLAESVISDRLHDPDARRRAADEETRRRRLVAAHAATVYARAGAFLDDDQLSREIDDLVRSIDSPAHRGDDFASGL